MSIVPAFIPALMFRERRDLARSLEAEGATSARDAIHLPEAQRLSEDRARSALEGAGALVYTPDGRAYLDRAAFAADKGRRRWKFAFALLLVALAFTLMRS